MKKNSIILLALLLAVSLASCSFSKPAPAADPQPVAEESEQTQTQTETVLYRRVCEIVKDIDGDSKGFQRLQKYIEDHLGNPISSLQKDIPSLGERDIRLFCYLVIGYDAPLISALMNVGKESTIYCWKNRLLGKIKRLPVTKAHRYLSLVR